MAAPEDESKEYAFDMEVALAAAKRRAKRKTHNKYVEESAGDKLEACQLDSLERCAARANRLLNRMKVDAQQVEGSLNEKFEESIATEVNAETINDVLLERIIGETRDFQGIEFLELGVYVCKAVGRITTELPNNRRSYGTGFMVSPDLLITNHHVLKSAADAARSSIEFDFQRNRLGETLSTRTFKLDPDRFFLNHKDLDFALVAVSPNENGDSNPLSAYGWLPLVKDPGKIVTGESINIIQHPKGEMKQVVIRENRLTDSFEGKDNFYHYTADTEPGSSGSPVFNDQWEVVALHHSGVPKLNSQGQILDKKGDVWDKKDPSELAWESNEGVRISKIIDYVDKVEIKPEMNVLRQRFIDAKSPAAVQAPPIHPVVTPVKTPANEEQSMSQESKKYMITNGTVKLTIPLHITISLGQPDSDSSVNMTPEQPEGDDTFTEAVTPDPNDSEYKKRPGYQENFLGFKYEFPTLTSSTKKKAFALPNKTGNAQYLLNYHHYSVIFNKSRKLAFVAGVNYDPTAPVQFKREGSDRWFYDPRVKPKEELQAGEDLYKGNPLDRGHLVRRADAAWGKTEKEAKLANDDTFHFTNCSPQHEITNQGKVKEAPPGLALWGKLEDHIAKQGKNNARKISVFNGPVFRLEDIEYRDVQIPKEFWKVAVFANDGGDPTAVAFVLTQAELIKDLEEEFEVGEYKSVQVSVKELEKKTGLDFGSATSWDVMEKDENAESFGDTPAVVLNSLEDIIM